MVLTPRKTEYINHVPSMTPGQQGASPNRTVKMSLFPLANHLPQFPNLLNQEACVWIWGCSGRDYSPTST